jgi:hypothetical protein
MAYDFDAYLAHAFPDKASILPLVRELRARGLRVWYDDDELQSGVSLRAQLDEGMRRSWVGIVVLSRAFFHPDRKWAPVEFDAWLDTGPTNRVIVVWLDVGKDEVQAWSRTAGTLVARRVDGPGAADAIARDVRLKIAESGSYSTTLRLNLEGGLAWTHPMQIFSQVSADLDSDLSWMDVEPPQVPAVPVPLPDLFERPTDFLDETVIVTGRQVHQQLIHREQGLPQEFSLTIQTSSPGHGGWLALVILAKRSRARLPIPRPPTQHHLPNVYGRVFGRGQAHFGSERRSVIVLVATRLTYMDPYGRASDGTPTILEWPTGYVR